MNQAADLISATASIPSLNFMPLTTFDNWFCPCNRRQFALHADGAMSHRREHALDRVRGSQVVPMIGGKVEERQQGLPILDQAFDGLVVFGRVFSSQSGSREPDHARGEQPVGGHL
jgi:hypothetical protein